MWLFSDCALVMPYGGHITCSTYWGRLTHICINNIAIIGSDNHYLIQCCNIVNWTLWNKLQWNFNQNSCIFIQENAFENVVWKMAAILCQPQCVNTGLGNGLMPEGIKPLPGTRLTYNHKVLRHSPRTRAQEILKKHVIIMSFKLYIQNYSNISQGTIS